MMRAVDADRVDRFGIAGQQKCLAAAAAEIDFFSRTCLTGLRHPGITAEALKGRRFSPDPGEVMFANIVEGEVGDHGCRVAWKRLP